MNYLAVTADYVLWWYTGGLKRLYLLSSALFGWLYNFFSVKRVLTTLFSPWKKVVGERRPGLEGFWDSLVDNSISRLVGLSVRLVIILIYLVSVLLLFCFSLTAFVLWVGWPILLIVSLIKMFFK